jgi:hypothetical protein
MADNMERAGKIVKEQKVSNQTDFKPKTEMRSVEDLTQKGSSIFE